MLLMLDRVCLSGEKYFTLLVETGEDRAIDVCFENSVQNGFVTVET